MQDQPESTSVIETEGASSEAGGPLAELINQRWSLVVLQALYHGASRFNAITRETGVNPNTLVDRLRDLEKLNIIERTIVQEFPLKVEYRLKVAGQELGQILDRFDNWIQTHGHAHELQVEEDSPDEK